MWLLAVAICANGMSVIASIWPEKSALTCAEGSAKSMIVTWSKYGCPVRQ